MAFFVIFVALLFGSVALAWWKGGAPERIIAMTFLAAWLVSVVLYSSDIRRYATIDWVGPVMNVVMAVILYLVARRANRRWPMLAASLQMLIVLAQIGRSLRHDWIWQVYLLMTSTWPFLELLVLWVGIIAHWWREKQNGPEPSWSTF